MNTIVPSPAEERSPARLILPALGFLVAGLAIFVFGSPFFDVFPTNDNVLFNTAVTAALALLWLRRQEATRWAGPPVYALLTAAAANLVLVIGPLNRLVPTASNPQWAMAQDKLVQFIYVVPVILVLNRLAGHDLGHIYLRRGRVGRWLSFGLASLVICAVVVAVIALGQGATTAELLSLLPYFMVFVLANAIMEELWFRGIFLRPYGAVLGGGGAMAVTALVFAVSHVNATYFESGLGWYFGLAVLAVGLVTAWAMRWAESLWGAVLFHMGMDLLIVFPILASL